MKRVKSLIFHSFNICKNDGLMPQFLADKLSYHPYLEETGFGFNNVEFTSNELSGNLIKRTPTFIQDYNEQSSELVKKQIFLFVSIPFSIDFEKNILLVQGGITQMNTLKSIFRNIFDFEYQIEPINLSAHLFSEHLAKKQIKAPIQQITIKEFNYKNGIVGRFSGEITKQDIGVEVINTYKSDIVKISFKIQIDENGFTLLQVFPNGNIKFISDENDFFYYLNYIKSLIFS